VRDPILGADPQQNFIEPHSYLFAGVEVENHDAFGRFGKRAFLLRRSIFGSVGKQGKKFFGVLESEKPRGVFFAGLLSPGGGSYFI
jgi:hypothetical protein